MRLYALDPYGAWAEAAIKAAQVRGWQAKQVLRGEDACDEGYGFIRLSMYPSILAQNRRDYDAMARRLTMIQDRGQIEVYENKSEQFRRWSEWMPDTWRFENEAEALAFVAGAEYPLVSKADVGASSVNVRILANRREAERHVTQAFGAGFCLQKSQVQRGYVLLQRFIPHRITYRVNALGDARAVFFRYCYPDRSVAQTGNVEPAFEMTDEVESLIDFADRFFAHAQTKWCAIDVLRDGDGWKLLETSEGWPWPSPGRCNEGTIFRSKSRKWIEMFDVMLDEIERGAWSGSSARAASSSTSTSTS